MDEAFRTARGAVQAFLLAGSPQASGSAQFAILHLVSRSLSDLGWAQNAATDRFPIQAYSLMRPAWEAMNLCDLFANKPELADAWAAGEYGKFAPAAVRKELDQGPDPFYSFLSERSHPRFAGLQMTIFKVEDETSPGDRQQAILHLNDLPIEVTAAYMAVATPAIILARLTAQAGRINFADPAHKPEHLAPMIRAVSRSLQAGWHAMDEGLEEWERDDPEVRRPREWASGFGGVLDRLADQVDETYRGGSQ
jgi:hypothetical protein